MQLEKGLNTFYEWGIDRSTVAERSIITPACGVGTIDPDKAERILELLSGLSSIMSETKNRANMGLQNLGTGKICFI